MTAEKEKTAALQTAVSRRDNLTLKYELRFEQGVYSLLCIIFGDSRCLGFDYIYDIAPRADKAQELLSILSEGFVTPISLREVLEELLG